MRVLFWGTPDFAVPSLRALDGEGFDVVGVVTQPDRPAGRGRHMKPSAVKELALDRGFEVLTPERPSDDEFLEAIRALQPEVSVVVAYGHILKPEVLAIPRLGSINVHASLLPALRGAAPIHWAISRGLEETGVTVMRMVEAMDAGAIIHQVREPIASDETATELTIRLSYLGAEALIEALVLIGGGQAGEVEQDHDAATYAPKVGRDTARIVWDRSNREVAAHVRAMDSLPGAWSELNGSRVKLYRPSVVAPNEAENVETPGTVLATDVDHGVRVMTGEGGVSFAEVQPPGRRRMSAADWINGRSVETGQRFV